ncbi:MAG: hypothetical protein QM589_12470 [Thermomicrobiales bacterium]
MGSVDERDDDAMDELVASVHDELLALRSAHGKLTVQKFSAFPTLVRVCGGGDLLDAYLTFERELRRYETTGNRDEVAAAISITAPRATVLERFVEVLGHYEDVSGKDREQRTARRWSDRGMPRIAADLAHMADIRGHLGVEILTIAIAGSRQALTLTVDHFMTKRLVEQAPLIRFWRYEGGDPVEQSAGLTVDLAHVMAPEAANAMYRLKRYTIVAELPDDLGEAEVDPGDPLYSISFENGDAPMHTVAFTDDSELGAGLTTRFTTYRTIATVEVAKTYEPILLIHRK